MFRAYCLVKGLLKAIRDASRILHSLLYVNADIKTFNSNSFSPPVACKFFDGSELPVVYRERVELFEKCFWKLFVFRTKWQINKHLLFFFSSKKSSELTSFLSLRLFSSNWHIVSRSLFVKLTRNPAFVNFSLTIVISFSMSDAIPIDL